MNTDTGSMTKSRPTRTSSRLSHGSCSATTCTAASSKTSSVRRTSSYIGADNVMIETDYPHTDTLWPNSLQMAHKMLAGVSDADKYKVLQGNARRIFHFEAAAVSVQRVTYSPTEGGRSTGGRRPVPRIQAERPWSGVETPGLRGNSRVQDHRLDVWASGSRPARGVTVLEASLFSPDALGGHLADLGARCDQGRSAGRRRLPRTDVPLGEPAGPAMEPRQAERHHRPEVAGWADAVPAARRIGGCRHRRPPPRSR